MCIIPIIPYQYRWKIQNKNRSGTLSLSLPNFDLESGDGCGRDFLQVEHFSEYSLNYFSEYSSKLFFRIFLSTIFQNILLNYISEYSSKLYLKVSGTIKDYGKTKLCGNNVSFFSIFHLLSTFTSFCFRCQTVLHSSQSITL